ncbi:MAG: hypothetical protein BWY70_00181 [Bacteroidetes bacterium ADurb.Bin408]|nr:MAG: hypothetical protein BWY70_00181 [Bacteroidetes bacterium ADurb.Bin408]
MSFCYAFQGMKITKKTFVKILKWILISLSSLIGCFIIFAFIIHFFYQDKIKNFIVDELNKNLRTEIKVDKIDLSLFSKFPYASLHFQGFYAKDAIERKQKDTLLYAQHLFLNFNIIDIFREQYKIKTIEVDYAVLKMNVYKDYSDNYTFWKESKDTTDTKFELLLKKIICKDVRVNYWYAPLKQYYEFDIINGKLNGRITDDTFKSKLTADVNINKIQIDDWRFINSQQARIALSLFVNMNTEKYSITDGELCLGDMCFKTEGFIDNDPEKVGLDLTIQGDAIDLPAFIEEMPEQLRAYMDGYKSRGEISFVAVIKGDMGAGMFPYINVDCGMKNGTLTQKKQDITLNNISFNARFNNGENHDASTSRLIFENFSASMPQGSANGIFSVVNFNQPILKAEAHADLNISELLKFLNSSQIKDAEGKLTMNVMFNGRINNLSAFNPEDFINSKCHGKAQLINTSFTLAENNKKVNNIDGVFQFNNNDIIIDDFEAHIGSSDIKAEGYFRNALSYAFLPGQTLSVDAGLTSQSIGLDELLMSQVKKNDTIYKMEFPENINYNIELNVKNLKFEKFEAKRFSGKISLKNKVMKAENVFFESCDALVNVSATIDGRKKGLFLTQVNAKVQNANIRSMFYQLDNFGQQELTEKNINGNLTTTIDFLCAFDSVLNIDLGSICAVADIAIDKGELIDYAPMQELSRYIKVSDLAHIKFETLQNKIEIKNRKITIPNMSIRSSAINIEASGTHTFDNVIEYHLRILLSELLGKKARQAKKENEEFGYVEDDGLGKTALYMKITGTVANPNISYDSKKVYEKNKNAVKEDIKNTFQKIGEELFRKNDTIKDLQTPKEKEKLNKLKKKKSDDEIIDGFKLE